MVAGLGAALGVFILLTLVTRTPSFDPCTIWTVVPVVPRWASATWFGVGAAGVILGAFGQVRRRWLRIVLASAIVGMVQKRMSDRTGWYVRAVAVGAAGRFRCHRCRREYREHSPWSPGRASFAST